MARLDLSKAACGDAHLWRERILSGNWLTCFPDQLTAETTGADLRIARRYRMMEI
jgi:hypothetical protein